MSTDVRPSDIPAIEGQALDHRDEAKAEAPRSRKRHPPVGTFPAFGPWTVAFMIFLYFPIAVLIFYSFNESRLALVFSEFSTRWYVKAFHNDDIRAAALNSLIVGVGATLVSTSIAIAAALALARGGNFKGKMATMGIISLPLAVPEIVTAVATLIFFSTIGLQLGIFNIMIAHIVFCIPFAFMPIRARLEGMDTTYEQAARDLYASEWEAFRYVTLPLLAPGIVAGAVLAFVISIDDFIISLMVSSAGSTTLPVYIYSMIRQGITPEVNAVSSILIGVSIILVSISWFVSRPRP